MDMPLGFNPLAGIRCFLTFEQRLRENWADNSFNPLAGIRCFLTVTVVMRLASSAGHGFNPLAGIRCFLT